MSSWSVLVAASVDSVRCRRRTVVGDAIVKRGGVRAVESGSIASKYKEYGADRVQGSGQAMAVAQHGRAKKVHCMFPGGSYLMCGYDGCVNESTSCGSSTSQDQKEHEEMTGQD